MSNYLTPNETQHHMEKTLTRSKRKKRRWGQNFEKEKNCQEIMSNGKNADQDKK
jgi:hypothetical protein